MKLSDINNSLNKLYGTENTTALNEDLGGKIGGTLAGKTIGAAAGPVGSVIGGVIGGAIGDKLTESESCDENIEEKDAKLYKDKNLTESSTNYSSSWEPVYNFVLNTLFNLESHELNCQDVAQRVSGYDPDWCGDDATSSIAKDADKARINYAEALTNLYLENAINGAFNGINNFNGYEEEDILSTIHNWGDAFLHIDDDEIIYTDNSTGSSISIGYIEDHAVNINPGIDLSESDKKVLKEFADQESLDINI